MFQPLGILQMAGALGTYAGRRQTLIAENIAQADTPGYQARDLVDFADAYRAGDADAVPVIVRAAGAGSPNGNTVSLESELVRSAEVKQQHDLALSVYRNLLGVLRTSLGRTA